MTDKQIRIKPETEISEKHALFVANGYNCVVFSFQ